MRYAVVKFRRHALRCRQDKLDYRRAWDYKVRLNLRTKARIYKAIKVFMHDTIDRRNVIRSLFRKLDYYTKVLYMTTWKRKAQQLNEEQLFLDEKAIVD
jgi:hypothetical protein